MRIAVYGLWHLGCVTAACLAEAGNDVVGSDGDAGVVDDLQAGRPPLHEPGLTELVQSGLRTGKLGFTHDLGHAVAGADVIWIAFDTPVNDEDEVDVDWIQARFEALEAHLRPGMLILISAQVPVGFTALWEKRWQDRGLTFAYSPENLQLGKALASFRLADRIVVGLRNAQGKEVLSTLLTPFCPNLLWMNVESAEMTKHALNAFLANSVSFINELARLCELVGADARAVGQGLKSDVRIGPRAYLSPGAAFAGGTLARDLRILNATGKRLGVQTPLLEAVLTSNDLHKLWIQQQVERILPNRGDRVVAVLGLTYKPDTSTLRRSSAVELCHWLSEGGIAVQAFDPGVGELPRSLATVLVQGGSVAEALQGADLAVVCTPWPQFRQLQAEDFIGRMRRPCVIDPSHHLAHLSSHPGLRYLATGVATRTADA